MVERVCYKGNERCVISSPNDRSNSAKVRIPHRSTVAPPPPPPPPPPPDPVVDSIVDVEVNVVPISSGDLSFFSREVGGVEWVDDDEPGSPCPLCRNHAEDSGA